MDRIPAAVFNEFAVLHQCMINVTMPTISTRYMHRQGCLQELTSWERLWGGTYYLVYDIKERFEKLGPEPFLVFSFRGAPTLHLGWRQPCAPSTDNLFHLRESDGEAIHIQHFWSPRSWIVGLAIFKQLLFLHLLSIGFENSQCD